MKGTRMSQCIQRTWWQIVATPYTGLRVLFVPTKKFPCVQSAKKYILGFHSFLWGYIKHSSSFRYGIGQSQETRNRSPVHAVWNGIWQGGTLLHRLFFVTGEVQLYARPHDSTRWQTQWWRHASVHLRRQYLLVLPWRSRNEEIAVKSNLKFSSLWLLTCSITYHRWIKPRDLSNFRNSSRGACLFTLTGLL